MKLCRAGGKNHLPGPLPESDPDFIWSGPNYLEPHIAYPGTDNCAACGISISLPAILPDGIYF